MAYEAGLQVDSSSDVLQKGLASVKKAMETDNESPLNMPDMGLGRAFSDPSLMRKLETNPKTKEFMKDAAFVEKLKKMQGGGQPDIAGMFGDPRMMTVLGVMMGVDMVGVSDD